jgi:hypothetical protein
VKSLVAVAVTCDAKVNIWRAGEEVIGVECGSPEVGVNRSASVVYISCPFVFA